MKRLAKISSATLEIKERGILNFWIHVDYEEGGSQGIGGLALDTYDKEKKKRIGTVYGCEMIRRLLLTLKVDDFSEMRNKIIWVIGGGDEFLFKPTGIQTLNVNNSGNADNNPLIFADILEEFKDKTNNG